MNEGHAKTGESFTHAFYRHLVELNVDAISWILQYGGFSDMSKAMKLQLIMHIRPVPCDYHKLITTLQAFQAAGVDLDVPCPRSGKTLLSKACTKYRLNADNWRVLCNSLIDAGAQNGGEDMDWVQARKQRRKDGIANMKEAQLASVHCLHVHGMSKDLRSVVTSAITSCLSWEDWI